MIIKSTAKVDRNICGGRTVIIELGEDVYNELMNASKKGPVRLITTRKKDHDCMVFYEDEE